MLSRIANVPLETCPTPKPLYESEQYRRNELDDMKKAIEYLYEFKEKLSKLHPIVQDAIENMLQRQRY